MEGLAPESLDGLMETRDDADFVPFGGGLLLAVPEEPVRDLIGALTERGVPAEVVEGRRVRVTG